MRQFMIYTADLPNGDFDRIAIELEAGEKTIKKPEDYFVPKAKNVQFSGEFSVVGDAEDLLDSWFSIKN